MARREWNPNTADWLVKQRGPRTQDAVIADMAARGVKVKRAWLSRIENGAPFSEELLAAFEDYYGSVPPPFEPQAEPPSDQSAIVAAIDRQTDMLRAVLETLRPSPPDPLVGQAQEAWAGAERQLAEEKAGTSSPPRKPSRARRSEARARESREADPA